MCNVCAVKKDAQENAAANSADDVFDKLIERGVDYAALNIEALKLAAQADGEEPGGEEFLPEEIILAGLLGYAVYKTGTKANKTMLKMIKDGGVDQFDEAVAAVQPLYAEAFDYPGTQTKVSNQLRRLLSKGSAYGGDAKMVFELPQTQQILKDMVGSTKYFTNQYFTDHVVPDLTKIISDTIAAGGNIDANAYTAVREAMEKRLKNVPYWRIVANASASRGFHYGAVKTGLLNGYQAYKWKSIIDSKTSKICRHLNGKEFWLADAELQVTRAAMAQGDEIKYVAPWLRENQIVDKDANELRELGVIMPPAHGSCRSTIEFI